MFAHLLLAFPFSLSLALYHCVTCMDITHFGFFKNHKLWAKYYPNLSFREFRQSMDVKWPLAVNFYHFSFKSVSQSVRQSSDQSFRWAGSQLVSQSARQAGRQAGRQSVSPSVSQSVRQEGRQAGRQAGCQLVSHSAVSQSPGQLVSQSTSKLLSQSFCESTYLSVSQLLCQLLN